MERTPPVRAVTDDEVASFWRDGVVCLRGILPPELVAAMAEPVERALGHQVADLSEMGDALAAGGAEPVVDTSVRSSGAGRGRFRAGTDHWVDDDDFRRFALRSPLGEVVAALLRSQRVHLYEDSVLVKEPGTRERTAFHQDMAYFHLDGDQVCTTWVPLDPVTEATGAVRFVVGSNLDRTTYRPNLFVTTMALPGTEGELVPDHFAATAERAEGTEAPTIVSFDTEPGDLTVHHARTLHGAPGNASATRRRRAISVRFAGDDVTYRHRSGAPGKDHHQGLVDGDRLDDERFPVAWP